ncbi:MAG: hypothetical protein JOZ04_11310, partial [Acidimicrobiia bacterium]|nr:hypothetical protein [Acidimicrobiia bacterium]
MAGFVIDLFCYAAVSGLCVGVWLLTAGSIHELTLVAKDPTTWKAYDFWPVWVIMTWGAAIVIHLGIVLAVGLFGGRARRRRKELARSARRAAHELHVQAHQEKLQRRQARHRTAEAPKPAGPERKWVTVMFTDIANSTGLTEDLGDDEWSRVLSAHRELVRTLFAGYGGEVVGTQ